MYRVVFFSLLVSSAEIVSASVPLGIYNPDGLTKSGDKTSTIGAEDEILSCARSDANDDKINFVALSTDSSDVLYLCYRMDLEGCAELNPVRFADEFCMFKEKPDYKIQEVFNGEGEKVTCSQKKHDAELFRVGYDFSFAVNDSWEKDIYRFCYNKTNEKTLYVEYKIISPKLLRNPRINLNNYRKDVKTSYEKELGGFTKKLDYFKKSKVRPDRKSWKPYLVVPAAHMAMNWWKDPVFHIVNEQLLREKFHSLMDLLNVRIKNKAIEVLGEVFIRAGVFDTFEDVYNARVWWKLIYSENMKYAIAVFLHNEEDAAVGVHCDIKSAYATCTSLGWGDIIPSFGNDMVYCCPPDSITEYFALPSVEIFDLKNLAPEKYKGVNKDCSMQKKENDHAVIKEKLGIPPSAPLVEIK